MHDEVFEAAAQDPASAARDPSTSAASSPSEAYANLTLESRESPAPAMAADTDTPSQSSPRADQPSPKPPPRSSSPAKRLHSDMDAPSTTQQDSPVPTTRTTKPLAAPSQRSARSSSVEMADAPSVTATAADADPTSVAPTSSANAPSLDDQVTTVLQIHQRPLSDGQEGYVISERWLERVFARTTENRSKPEQFDKAAVEGEIGPVDNSDLVDPALSPGELFDLKGEEFVALRPGLAMSQDFEILPSEAWELIISWYGLKEGSPVIRRYVHNTAVDEMGENLQYEVYPPIFTIRKVRKSASGTQTPAHSAKPSPKLVASRSDRYVQFLKAAKKAAGIDMATKVRVWRVLNTAPTDQPVPPPPPPPPPGMLTPDASPERGSPLSGTRHQPLSLSMDQSDFGALAAGTDRELVTGKDETANEKYNGSSTLHIVGLAEDQVLILEEQDSNGNYPSASTKVVKSASQVAFNKAVGQPNKASQSNPNSRRSSPVRSGALTRGRTRTGRTRGTVGLINLGNTCYMNSALQCIRSVEELYFYFLTEKWKGDLNPSNPLGHGGAIAKSYASLLSSIYNVEGASSFSPKNFKQALGRAQPLFSGYGQQDSQEFLSFLVDALHEDLNRIKQKPYTENPESDDNTVHDPEAIKALGEKFREIHRSRNDSVAMDLFNGFYKNTMVCPDCGKVSITFDPYSLLTLQMPIEQTWQHTITFVPLKGQVINVVVDIDKNATIKNLKEYIAKRFPGVKWNRLMGAEVYTHKFYRMLENNKSIAECNIGQRDIIFFYELPAVPTNWPPPKKKQQRSMLYPMASSDEDIPKSASPLGDRMLVPIFHRSPNHSYRGSALSMTLWPSYIVLTREEAKDYDTILKKVLAKVAQMTSRSFFDESAGIYKEGSRTSSDIVLTTDEDASPSGDSRVQDGSVEGEDNMVEVTMADRGEEADMDGTVEDIPEILRPGSFIPPQYRELFDMKYTRPGKELVPTGWSTIDANKAYESISSRVPAPSSPQSSAQSPDEDAATNASSSEEPEDTAQFSADAHSSFQLANDSSDEGMPSLETETFARGGRQNSKKNKRKNKKNPKRLREGYKQNGRKGKDVNRFQKQETQAYSDLESDDEALIRLGEAIVLDWNASAYDGLFEGNPRNPGDQRGVDVTTQIATLDDPELAAKKAKRAARKRNGITLEECFAETSKSEVLSEDNAWYCGRCKELRRATKTLEIWTAPDILVIHLKRFSANRAFRDKIEAFVDCPLEGLDLSGKVGLPEDKSLVYDLFAVDNHYGGLGGGHYTACARNFFDGQWYDYNDSIVSPKNPDNVVTSAAYLLFYRRRSDRPLGPPYLQRIADQFRNPDSEIYEDPSEESDSAQPASLAAGNGLRLGDSSRNGSSSAFGAAAGAPAAGLVSAGNLQQNGAVVGTAGDDSEMLELEPPPPYDEGYAGGDTDDGAFENVSAPGPFYGDNDWSFANIGDAQSATTGDLDDTFDEGASDLPNMAGDDLQSRILEDFGDELGNGIQPGMSTPLEEEVPALLGDVDEDEVTNVVLDDEEVPSHNKME